MRVSSRWVAPAFAAALLACGSSTSVTTGGGGTGGGGPAANAVSVEDNSFGPATLTVAVGDTVTWTWNGANRHSVTFDDGTTSPTQSSGTFLRVFSSAGTYPYHCVVHGAAMSGTVTVQ